MSEKLIELAIEKVNYLNTYYFENKSVKDLLFDLKEKPNDNVCARVDIIIKIITSLWGRHNKDEIVNKMDDWYRIEQFLYTEKKYRDHLQHQLYVYLLGSIVIEDNFNEAFHEIIENLLKNFEFTDFIDRTFSLKDRIHFVWMMASTFHDYGYPIEKFNTIFDSISSFFREEYGKSIKIDPKSEDNGYEKMFNELIINIKCIEDLVEIPHFNEEFFLERGFPWPENRIDHGIFSGMILIPKISKIIDLKKTKADKLLWKVASRTMALHNYRGNKINVEKDPLLALLIICDEIQDWDRKYNRNGNDLDYTIENIEVGASGINLEICIINANTEKFLEIMEKKRSLEDLIIPKKCNKEYTFNVCYKNNNAKSDPPVSINLKFLCKNG